ncbi:hypothetical protein Tsubulata_007563 [Turnera subulata]|uniref:DUF4283 domain-containing protein n=1 Tax=Turnera subulata TaxID=218843 RepID=A0A9Q0F3D2_9ROSI|nr:hypothetical protein Tsubulata_007563 [Turnera subulata]
MMRKGIEVSSLVILGKGIEIMVEPSSRRVINLGGETAQQDSVSPGAIVARTYVIKKVLGDRKPHISQIRSQMQSVWCIKGDFRIIPKMNNIFLIGFELEEDKKKVLKGSPWLVSNMYFCLKGWFPDMILSQDIPPNLLTHDRVVKIEAVFPVLHFYEPTLEAMLGWQGFIRARVEIETNMPLFPGVACLDQSGKEIWIKFKYERLGELCVRCGRITHPTSRCTKPPQPDEGVEKSAENNFGPWMRANETLGKYYPAKKQVPLEMAEPNMEEENPPDAGYNGRAPSTSSSSEKQGEEPVSRKRKLPEEDVLLSSISESRQGHTGLMNIVAELVTDLHDTDPIHTSASKPSRKKMARRARVVYQPTLVELIQAFEATVEGSKTAMGQEAGNGKEVEAVVVEPSPAGD